MLIFMGFNAVAAARIAYMTYYTSSSYGPYSLAVAMSVIEAFAFIASLIFAKKIKSENKIIVESSNDSPRNTVPTNK